MPAPLPTHPFFTLTDGTTLAFSRPGRPLPQEHPRHSAAAPAAGEPARPPADLTHDERLTLAHYSAFGESALLRRALGADASDLDGLISTEEARALKRASLNAFYTSEAVLHAKWAALMPMLEQLPGPIRVLEPAFGIGNYVATMPLAVRQRAQITAVELDRITSQIASLPAPRRDAARQPGL